MVFGASFTLKTAMLVTPAKRNVKLSHYAHTILKANRMEGCIPLDDGPPSPPSPPRKQSFAHDRELSVK